MFITSSGKITDVSGGLYGIRSISNSNNDSKGINKKNQISKIEIFYSIEFIKLNNNNENDNDSNKEYDLNFIKNRKELSDHLFSNQNYELIGYFFTTPGKLDLTDENGNLKANPYPNPKNEELLKVMKHFSIENPICLILSTDIENENNLPISFFSLNSSNEKFEKLSHKIAGNDSERITLDTVMKFSENSNLKNEKTKNLKTQNLKTFKNAFDVLKEKLNLILSSLKSEKFRNDKNFLKKVDEIICNIPNSSYDDNKDNTNTINVLSEMDKILEEKYYENVIINSINLNVVNKIFSLKEEKN
jgi:hypothetical protein